MAEYPLELMRVSKSIRMDFAEPMSASVGAVLSD